MVREIYKQMIRLEFGCVLCWMDHYVSLLKINGKLNLRSEQNIIASGLCRR